jgi:hypothetical protein
LYSAPVLESSNLSRAGPWAKIQRSNAPRSFSDVDYLNGSTAEDGNSPPPKPPFPKSRGKRLWSSSFNHVDEDELNSGSEARIFHSHTSETTESDLSVRWLRHLKSSMSTASEAEKPNGSSFRRPEYVAALTGAALCLANSRSLDRKRKRRRTSFGKSSKLPAREPQPLSSAPDTSGFNYYDASNSSLRGGFPERYRHL